MFIIFIESVIVLVLIGMEIHNYRVKKNEENERCKQKPETDSNTQGHPQKAPNAWTEEKNQRTWEKVYDSVITFGKTSFTLLALINGGAAAAILAAATSKSSVDLTYMMPTLFSFLWGAILACLGCGFAYFAEFKTLMKLQRKDQRQLELVEVMLRNLAVILGIASLVNMLLGFILGVYATTEFQLF